MKKLEAIIRHELLEKVRDALDKAGYHGLTISEVRGAGSQRGYTESYRGAKATIVFRPKVKVEIVVEAEQVDEVIDEHLGPVALLPFRSVSWQECSHYPRWPSPRSTCRLQIFRSRSTWSGLSSRGHSCS